MNNSDIAIHPKYICPSNRNTNGSSVSHKIGSHEESTLSVLPKAVLLPKCDKADAELENTEENRCGCFDRHRSCGKRANLFEVNEIGGEPKRYRKSKEGGELKV
jgi:hypothetical protein